MSKHIITDQDIISSLQIPIHVASSLGEGRSKRLMYSSINREFQLHVKGEIIWRGGTIEEAAQKYNEQE